MLSFAEKIEADAAKRLTLPEGRQPAQELARYKHFLKLENHRVAMLHKSGVGGLEVSRARSTVIDVLIRHILAAVESNLLATRAAVPRFAVVAIGGYGRGELNPFSDIDIMFLHAPDLVTRGKAHPSLAALTDALLYSLWDIGLKVGHSVRSVEDAVVEANREMQSKTSLIESRLVAGEPAMFVRFQAVIVAKCVRGHEKAYLKARLEDQVTRRTKFGNSPFMQEPNIKNGCGGLRDYQNLLWMTFFKYRVRTLKDLEPHGLISETERKQLDAAYDYLMLVRNELHYIAKRAVDVIAKNVQPTLANNLGFTDRSPSRRLEEFMRNLFLHMRHIYLITRTLEQRLALSTGGASRLADLFRKGKQRVTQQVVDGFKIIGTQICEGSRSFKEQPRRLMRVFLHAQQRGVTLRPDLAQLIRNQLPLINREFCRDPHVSETFLQILTQRGNVASILRTMHEVGFLGKYIPEFGKLTCMVQHEFYHQYTVDEHTLVCLEKLDQIWAATEPPLSRYTQLFQNLEHPWLLYLALLLHDAGKGVDSKDHSEVGGKIARGVARRLGLNGTITHSLRLIIENHLLMVQISQRRDLDDQGVIRSFASVVQNSDNLVMLTLHTLADSLGTSDQLWNGFKDSLLQSLLTKTAALLSGGDDFIRAEQKQVELLNEEVQAILPSTMSEEEITAHFQQLPPRYFAIHSARQIAADVCLAHRFMHLQLTEEDQALVPVVTWQNEPDRGFTSLHVCTWDRPGVFTKIAACLTGAGLNVLTAQIFTRGDGIILDTFYVTDAKTGAPAKKEEREKFERIFNDTLQGKINIDEFIAQQPRLPSMYQALEDEEIPTRITFDNSTAERRTVIDIETKDRVGLLYYISQTLTELKLDMALAKIVTEKGAAIDAFYVRNLNGTKITTETQQKSVHDKLRQTIARMDRIKGRGKM